MRLAGQDTRRGTFSQRHSVLVDHATEAEYTPLAHLGDARRAVHDLRLRALGVRGARLRVRLLGRRPRRARVLGSAVRRLRQRRADDHRPVHRRRRRQVGPAQRTRAAAPPRLRGPGPRALVGPARALPRVVRAGQHPRRLPDHRRAVLPRAAAPGARSGPQADDRDDAEALPAHAGDVLPRRRVRVGVASSSCSPTPPRPIPRRSRGSCSAPASSATSCSPRRDEVARARRDRAARAALPVARARDRRAAATLRRTPR